jgi:lipid-binding SYLF domain-containing protein
MSSRIAVALTVFIVATSTQSARASEQSATVEKAESVLKEIMEIPAKKIPSELLESAHGVAIIPSVIKIGFVAGVRRGHGVLMVKDKDGDWGLPQFVILTGGSVGWQVGAQSTDVILVFKTAKSVENIQKGKFTIGADAAAAAGPVGRNAAAATDAQLKAEILSYSRSRGLFAGVSLDGSMIEVDHEAARDFYGDPRNPTRQVPACAVKLLEAVAAHSSEAKPVVVGQTTIANSDINRLRRDLAQSARHLNAILPPEWQQFLALPGQVYGQQEHSSMESLNVARKQYERIASDATYANLSRRPEFKQVLEDLREYAIALSKIAVIPLPPPPPGTSIPK